MTEENLEQPSPLKHVESYATYGVGHLLSVAASEAKPCKGSHQRRVGRSASDGLPGVVTRVVGRKKAYRRLSESWEGLTEMLITDARWLRKKGHVAASRHNLKIAKITKEIARLVKRTAAAASRRRQRAIPANEALRGGGENL